MRIQDSKLKTPEVVFDGRYIQDRYHGIGRYAFEIIGELAQLLPSVDFAVLRDPALAESRFDWSCLAGRQNVGIVSVDAPLFGVKEQVAVPRAVLAAGSKLYHTPYFALPWALPARGIVTVHDCIFERDARYMPQRWARLYYTLLMQASLRRSSAVVVPSKATAADVRRLYGVPGRKITITLEAADPAFHPIRDTALLREVRARYHLPQRFLLAVGARRPHKNFARLVQAASRIEGATLVFAGDADERFADDAASAAAKLGSERRDAVRFLGKVPEPDLPVLYNLATAVACPSYIEGFGLPVLEAMACGTPVVCSDIPVFREVAGENALYAPPKETQAWAAALRRVLGEPALREHLAQAGLEHASHFSWREGAVSLLPLYRRLMRLARD